MGAIIAKPLRENMEANSQLMYERQKELMMK